MSTTLLPGTRMPAVPNRPPRLSAIDYLALERDRETQFFRRAIERPLPELVRNSFTAVADPGSALAFACEDLLGYAALRRSQNLPGPLARALAKLEIEFLDNGSVVAYKTAMLERQNARVVHEAKYDHIAVDTESAEVPALREGLSKVNSYEQTRALMRVQQATLQHMMEESERLRIQFVAVDPANPEGLVDVIRWNIAVENMESMQRRQVVAEIGWKTVSLRGYEPPAEMPDRARCC